MEADPVPEQPEVDVQGGAMVDVDTTPAEDVPQDAPLSAEIEAILVRLEDFLGHPSFTSLIEQYVTDNSHHFEDLAPGQEQPLEYYERYQAYVRLIEGKLEEFLRDNGITQEQLFDACSISTAAGGVPPTCVDYLLAVTEYEAFLQLMADCRSMSQWECDMGDPVNNYLWGES